MRDGLGERDVLGKCRERWGDRTRCGEKWGKKERDGETGAWHTEGAHQIFVE